MHQELDGVLWAGIPAGLAVCRLTDGAGLEILRINPAFRSLTGCPGEGRCSLIQRLCGELHDTVAAAVAGPESCSFEHYFDITQRWGRVEVTPLQGPEFLLTVFDITRRRQAEAELQQSRAGYFSLFEQAADGVLVGTGDGTIIEANRSICEMSGYLREELIGTNISMLFPRPVLEQKPLDYSAVQAGATVLNERELKRRDGRIITVEMNTRKVGDGRLQAYLRDITARKQMIAELQDSEQRLRTVFENTPLGLVYLDREGVILDCNEPMAEIMGAPRQALLGFNTLQQIRDSGLRDAIKRSLHGEYAFFEGEYLSVSGGRRSRLRVHANPVNRGAEHTEAIGILEDVSEQMEAARRVQESEEHLRITLDAIGDGVISTDSAGCIVRLNRVAAELTGLNPDQVTGKLLDHELYLLENGRRVVGPLSRLIRAGADTPALPRETILVHRSGREFNVSVIAAPIRNDAGEAAGSVVVFRDITGQQLLQERLRQAEKMEAVGRLAGGVAHDFNNMLAGIMGGAELLLLQPLNETARSCLEMITGSARRAADLTAKLLAFGRKAKMEFRLLDLHEVINSSVEMLRHSLPKKITIRTVLKAEQSYMTGDFTQLQNMLINLGLNAGHAMEEGGELQIETETHPLPEELCNKAEGVPAGSALRLRVRDSGCGIPPEDLDRIFEPFFTTRKHGKGSGLGLAAVYGTVQEHGGSISVESREGLGTVFTVYLPAVAEAPELPEPPAGILSGSGTVLLVEDEPTVRRAAVGMLAVLGYDVVEAENGRIAIEKYADLSAEIDLILLDMLMPEMDGRESFSRLRAINPQAQIVIASGFARDEDINRLLQQGAAGFLHKPYSISELSRVLSGGDEK